MRVPSEALDPRILTLHHAKTFHLLHIPQLNDSTGIVAIKKYDVILRVPQRACFLFQQPNIDRFGPKQEMPPYPNIRFRV